MLPAQSISPVTNMMGRDEVQSVVHDLRSPIAVIKGNLQLLLSGVMGQMTSEQLLLIKRSVDPLEDLILLTDNLLQSTSLEKDLEMKHEATDLDKVLSETIDFYADAFRQREMELIRDGNTVGKVLNIETLWMKRVLNNLIWNAYKFTPDHGRVVIQVELVADGLNVIISDNGRGIPAAKMQNLFQKNVQSTKANDGKIGTGLGLWICKRVLELHGASIRAESLEGKGSRFILHFPARCILK